MATDKIIRISDILNDNRLITPAQAMEDALLKAESDPNYTSGIAILLNRADDNYNTAYFLANLSASEAIALLEWIKSQLLDIMHGRN